MTLRMRSKVFWAFLALPFQMRQCSRSTSVTIVALASLRPGSSVSNPLAASFMRAAATPWRCGTNLAIGRVVTSASARISRSKPGTAVGERCHLCGSGSADCLEAPANLNRNVGVGSGDGTEDLPPAVGWNVPRQPMCGK